MPAPVPMPPKSPKNERKMSSALEGVNLKLWKPPPPPPGKPPKPSKPPAPAGPPPPPPLSPSYTTAPQTSQQT
jgi:hypothetical protein